MTWPDRQTWRAAMAGGLLACVAGNAAAGPVFNVRQFGAVGDGRHADTVPVQQALDACSRASGGTVLVPAGNYLIGPIRLASHVALDVEPGATLKATDDPADYLPPDVTWLEVLAGRSKGPFKALISGRDLEDVTLCGGGVVDGSGARWWQPAEAARLRQPGYTLPRPNLIAFTRVNHLLIENVTLQNSPKFHLVPVECRDVVIRDVKVRAPEHAANTDAIDPGACLNLLITNCVLDVGDDDIAIKAGGKAPGRAYASEHTRVVNCSFLHGHGMSIGSETLGGVDDVVVENCTFTDTENGLRIKSDLKRGGVVQNVLYRDIRMTRVTPAITFTCVYLNNSASDPAARQAPAGGSATGGHLPLYRNIRVENLRATCPQSAGMIVGLPGGCISNVDFENVEIRSATGLTIRNARGVTFHHSKLIVRHGGKILAENAEVSGGVGEP